MKITVEFWIEISMIVATAYESYNVYMIMDFSALIVVNFVDSYYFNLINDNLKDKMMKAEMKLPIKNKEYDHHLMGKFEKVTMWMLKLTKWMYETIYFHFMPYLAIFYSFYGVA